MDDELKAAEDLLARLVAEGGDEEEINQARNRVDALKNVATVKTAKPRARPAKHK